MVRRIITLIVSLMVITGASAQDHDAALQEAMRTLDGISTLLTEQEHNIVHLEAQLDNISKQQLAINDTITRQKWQLAQLRGQYAQVVRNLHAHSTVIDQLAFVFSASSIGQAWQRASYLRQLSKWREERSNMLATSLKRLNAQQHKLQQLAETRQASLMACNTTRVALQTQLQKATALVVELRGKAPQLQAVLNEKREHIEKLDNSLDRITASQSATQGLGEPLTAELQQGSLQHPVNGRHSITGTFGKQQHPTLQYVSTVNNGIDITCNDSHATAIAVEEGIVSGIYEQDGKCIVIVRHGEYLSVYDGLTHITVKKGQRVTSRQTLGDISLDAATHKPVLHFELRKGYTALNPEDYLNH